MRAVSKELVSELHKIVIAKSGGLHGLRDEKALESTLMNPFQTFEGRDLYEGNILKCIVISYGLIQNHCFVDGNKRIGILMLITLLNSCGYTLSVTQDDLYDLAINVASGKLDMEGMFDIVSKKVIG